MLDKTINALIACILILSIWIIMALTLVIVPLPIIGLLILTYCAYVGIKSGA